MSKPRKDLRSNGCSIVRAPTRLPAMVPLADPTLWRSFIKKVSATTSNRLMLLTETIVTRDFPQTATMFCQDAQCYKTRGHYTDAQDAAVVRPLVNMSATLPKMAHSHTKLWPYDVTQNEDPESGSHPEAKPYIFSEIETFWKVSPWRRCYANPQRENRRRGGLPCQCRDTCGGHGLLLRLLLDYPRGRSSRSIPLADFGVCPVRRDAKHSGHRCSSPAPRSASTKRSRWSDNMNGYVSSM